MGAAALLTGLATPAAAALGRIAFRSLSFENLHTGERLKVDYWIGGRYQLDALGAVDQVLRDFRTGEVHRIEPKLLDLLTDLRHALQTNQPFQVISGYRSPQTNAMLHEASSGVAAGSLHMQGMAIDIRVPGRPLRLLHRAALDLRQGGVGYYPQSDFVHVDVGRMRFW